MFIGTALVLQWMKAVCVLIVDIDTSTIKKWSIPMKRIRTIEAMEHIGERVIFKGWLQNVRRLGGVNFVILRDGWGTIQAVTENNKRP